MPPGANGVFLTLSSSAVIPVEKRIPPQIRVVSLWRDLLRVNSEVVMWLGFDDLQEKVIRCHVAWLLLKLVSVLFLNEACVLCCSLSLCLVLFLKLVSCAVLEACVLCCS